jgi:arginyl-tRNA synthetase
LQQFSDGALVVYSEGILDRDGNPFGLIIRKSDGGYGYATTDFAALKYNAEVDKADKVVYVIDARQSQHMSMIFDGNSCRLDTKHIPFHAAFGTILGEDQKPFKTTKW